jgi:hypothetical protein
MEFTKTEEKTACPIHGDSMLVSVNPGWSSPPTSPFHVCYRCLENAINDYIEPLHCVDCGVMVPPGYGVEKNGILRPMCLPCMGLYFRGKNGDKPE